MSIWKVVLLTGAVVVSAVAYLASRGSIQADDSNTFVFDGWLCDAKFDIAREGKVFGYSGTCTNVPDVLESFAKGTEKFSEGLRRADVIGLGKTTFFDSEIFDTCGLLEPLATNSDWTSATDSASASAVLKQMNPISGISDALSNILAEHDRKVVSIDVETLQLDDTDADTGCASAPDKVPSAAQIWLNLAPL